MKKAYLAAIVILLLMSPLFTVYEQSNQIALGRDFLPISYVSSNLSLENFTIVVLPDTQGYSENYPWIFDNQTQWIVNNVDALNIVFVTQLGDLVNIPYNRTQWENANQSMSKLDGKVPWAVLLGNHDLYNGNLTNYNTYFGYERFSEEAWYGGAYNVGDNANSYQLFSGGGDDYLIFHLQCDPSDDVLYWASNIIDSYPDSKVIVSTHDYLMGLYKIGQRSEIGERIWHSLVKPHADQVFLVLCGHAGAEDLITDEVDGHVVYQVLADYQNAIYIESGWLRILEFAPSQEKIFVKTYSPILNEYKHDSQSEFTLDYNTVVAPSAIPESAARENTIYIRADGSVEPSTAPIRRNGDAYVFEDDINGSLVVERNNVVIDGSGFTLHGTGSSDYLSDYEQLGFVQIGNQTAPLVTQKDSNKSYTGIYSCSEKLTVKNLTITEFLCGIELEYASDNCIVDNEITNNTQGICIHNSSNNTISRNTVSNNRQGITLTTSHDSIQDNNLFNNSEYGIKLSWSFNNISGNNIANNTNGVCVTLSSHNTFSANIFLNNTKQVNFNPIIDEYHDDIDSVTTQPALVNNWDDGSKGNCWSDYNGTDANNDGIGDTPYMMDANNKDNYPLMTPITNSIVSSDPTPSPRVEFPAWSILVFVVAVSAFLVALKAKKAGARNHGIIRCV
ncbi:MAG: NosD domain-containing protein [Candidatus Bathyarchaeia archaeon]